MPNYDDNARFRFSLHDMFVVCCSFHAGARQPEAALIETPNDCHAQACWERTLNAGYQSAVFEINMMCTKVCRMWGRSCQVRLAYWLLTRTLCREVWPMSSVTSPFPPMHRAVTCWWFTKSFVLAHPQTCPPILLILLTVRGWKYTLQLLPMFRCDMPWVSLPNCSYSRPD